MWFVVLKQLQKVENLPHRTHVVIRLRKKHSGGIVEEQGSRYGSWADIGPSFPQKAFGLHAAPGKGMKLRQAQRSIEKLQAKAGTDASSS